MFLCGFQSIVSTGFREKQKLNTLKSQYLFPESFWALTLRKKRLEMAVDQGEVSLTGFKGTTALTKGSSQHGAEVENCVEQTLQKHAKSNWCHHLLFV